MNDEKKLAIIDCVEEIEIILDQQKSLAELVAENVRTPYDSEADALLVLARDIERISKKIECIGELVAED